MSEFLKSSAVNLNTLLVTITLGVAAWVGKTVTETQAHVMRIEEAQKHAVGDHAKYEVAITELRTRVTAVELEVARLRAEYSSSAKHGSTRSD